MPPRRVRLLLLCGSLAAILAAGCKFNADFFRPWWIKPTPPAGATRIQAIRFVDPINPVANDEPAAIRGARNQTVSVAFRINKFPENPARKDAIRLSALQHSAKGGPIALGGISAWQILPVPVDSNRAGFVRHTGLSATAKRFPRALLPLKIENGSIAYSALRSPDAATDPKSHASPDDSQPPMIWIDIQIPPTAAAGEYHTSIDLFEDGKIAAKLPVKLLVDDFVLPDERHLLMAGTVDWRGLQRMYPQAFRGFQPFMLSRREPRYSAAMKVLDDIVKTAQAHRLQVYIPDIQPMVKWPYGQGPDIDWADYDSIVTPWLRGDAFPDSVALSFWPIPLVDKLETRDADSRMEYIQAAAAHFDASDWLGRAPVMIEKKSPGRVRIAESVEMSKDAARVLSLHPNVRVVLPLEEEQIQVSSAQLPACIPPTSLSRVTYMAAGLVSRTPVQRLPTSANPAKFLQCEDTPDMPYVGAGADEREVRMWAWLAFAREAGTIVWPSILPADGEAATPADPAQLVWFYPGSWFGVDGLVPTLHLKWLRHAQQDYECLYLARQRGQTKRAATLARLITKPVELSAAQSPDSAHALLSGTSDLKAWEQVAQLLARTIELTQPGQLPDPTAERQLGFDAAAWTNLQERPLLMARNTDWGLGIIDAEGNNWLNLRLGIDIYNAADRQPDKNSLRWAAAPEAWSIRKEPEDVPKLGQFSVTRGSLEARVALNRLTPASRRPIRATFQDGYSGKPYTVELLAPIVRCEKWEQAPLKVDGYLGDWIADDAILDGKLVMMHSRPSVQRQELEYAPTSTALYTTWTDANLYIGFRVEGADVAYTSTGTNFVRYDFRRAWGEDICEALVQAVYSDNSLGPLLHLAVKPHGQLEVSRRLNPKLSANPWQSFAATDIRYAYHIEKDVWRGEMALPWEAVKAANETGKKIALLRFNFVQHYGSSGQSASWAGPIDFGRDDAFTGLLELHSSK